MKRVLVFGTFDVLHPGHEWFLTRAASRGDHLTAVVARDEFVRKWKSKSPVYSQEERIRHLEESGLVDRALLADPRVGSYHVLETDPPDLICLGHDQEALRTNLLGWMENRDIHVPVEVFPAWKRHLYSSSLRNG